MKRNILIKKCAADGAMLAALLLLINFAFVWEINKESTRMVLSTILVPIGGAIGGIVVYLINPMVMQSRWARGGAIALSVIIYCLIVSIAFVLGVNSEIEINLFLLGLCQGYK